MPNEVQRKTHNFEDSKLRTADEDIDLLVTSHGYLVIHTNLAEDKAGADAWLKRRNNVMLVDRKTDGQIHNTENFVIETHHVSNCGDRWPGWAYKLAYIDFILYFDKKNRELYAIPTGRIEENLVNWSTHKGSVAYNNGKNGRPYTTHFKLIPKDEMVGLKGVKHLTLGNIPVATKRTTEPWTDYLHVDLIGKGKRFEAPDHHRVIRVTDTLRDVTTDFSPKNRMQQAYYARYAKLFAGLESMNRLPNVLRAAADFYRTTTTPHGTILKISGHQWEIHHEAFDRNKPNSEIHYLKALSQAIVADKTIRAQILYFLEEAQHSGFRNSWKR